jgi:hypothetical protein
MPNTKLFKKGVGLPVVPVVSGDKDSTRSRSFSFTVIGRARREGTFGDKELQFG